ncbi:MAG: hypothetical protein ACR2H9_04750 [Longimicrobiaceae bacterium]
MRRFLVLALLMLTGCYTYAPVRDTPLVRGTSVRAELSTPSDFRLTELTANNVVSVAGEVVRQDTDTLVMSAMWLRAQTGYEFPAAGETVLIPSYRLAALEQRRLSPARSAAFGGAIALAGVLLAAAMQGGGAAGGGSGGKTNPQ